MLILKYSFIDVTDGRRYEVGEDVSHVSDPAKKFLTENGVIEVVQSEDENVGKKPKKK
jgi:hypothetical protein